MQLQQPHNASAELIVRPATGQDVRDMAPRLRIADKAEIVASTGEPALLALGRGFASSEKCWTVEWRGRPAAMFGCVPIIEDGSRPRVGSIWLLGTDDINLFGYRFLHESQKWVEIVTKGYDLVGNIVDARNLKHIKWLKWLGFKFVRTIPDHGIYKIPFHEFVKIV